MQNKAKKKRLVLGITGSFGSGKTTVARMFTRLGASSLNADRIYHQLIKPQAPLYKRMVCTFGREILRSNNEINRKKLGKIVFSKGQALKRLCQITHSSIIRRMKKELPRLKKVKGCPIIVIDAPLLIEAGLIKMVDKLIVIKTNKKKQIARCVKHWGMPPKEVMKRIRAQAPLAEKIKLADYVIDNNGTLQQTRRQVKDIWRKIRGG